MKKVIFESWRHKTCIELTAIDGKTLTNVVLAQKLERRNSTNVFSANKFKFSLIGMIVSFPFSNSLAAFTKKTHLLQYTELFERHFPDLSQ